MTSVVHVSVAGAVWWKKSADAWHVLEAPQANAKAPVWVVTDLAEETFTEIKVPRVFGADRASYIRRQLVNRFPDSVFRIALPAPQAGGLMDRLAPPSQILTAVEPADRVELALAHIKAPVAGVWTTSMLMARIGQRASMPAHLFVVLIQPGGMRILFIKHRVPVLTRLITAALTDLEQAAEIIRTLRHLENTHVVERTKEQYAVLLMGGNAVLQAKLSEDRLTMLPLPSRWNISEQDGNWSRVLFDQAIKSPAGQLAPLKYRTTYLAGELSKGSRLGALIVVLAAAAVVGVFAMSALDSKQQSVQVNQQINTVASDIATTDAAITAFGVSPDMVRKAVALDRDEIEAAPDLRHHLVRLSQVISAVPDARLKNWQWRVLDPQEIPCILDVVNANAPPPVEDVAPETNPDQPVLRKVELKISVAFADGVGPHQLMQKTADITKNLSRWKGAKVMQDPAQGLREGSITIKSALEAPEVRNTIWCVSVPATIQGQP